MRVKITLACTETGDRNYITTKNKRTHRYRQE
ncbi:50S ribosomal protein L33, partial [Bacillus smithii]